MELILSIEANLAARWRDWLDTSLRARSPFHGTPETSRARWASLRHNAFVLSTTESIPRAGSTRRRTAPSSGECCAWTPTKSQSAWHPASCRERVMTSPFGHSPLWRSDCRGRACSWPAMVRCAQRSRRWRVATFRRVKSASWGSSMTFEASSACVTWCCSRRCRRSGRVSGSQRLRRWRQGCPWLRPTPDRYPRSSRTESPAWSSLLATTKPGQRQSLRSPATAHFATVSETRPEQECAAKFSVDQMADRTVAVYREVVTVRGTPVIASRVRASPASRSAARHDEVKRRSSRPASHSVRRFVRQLLDGAPAMPRVHRASRQARTYEGSDMPETEVGVTDRTVP